jgi:hypothetical protein
MTGRELFASYAFPPNELGYCGPGDTGIDELASHAKEFDGAWPYLQAIADAVDGSDPLDAEVVRNYWIGGPLLEKVDAAELLSRLRTVFTGQVTGMLGDVDEHADVLANHSFHVFVVYPWIRFLDRDPSTPLRVMQDCRIRWGTVQSVEDEHAVLMSEPLTFDGAVLGLGDPAPERVRWRHDGAAPTPAPVPGTTVTAHWQWICGTVDADECGALAAATRHTLDLVNRARRN